MKYAFNIYEPIRNLFKQGFLVGFFLFQTAIAAHASHIAGGHLEMQAVKGKSYTYRFNVYFSLDELNLDMSMGVFQKETEAYLTIYRKKDNEFVQNLTLPFIESIPFIFTNESCADKNKLDFSKRVFSKEFTLDPNKYNDPEGYYIVYGRCCRNGIIQNITAPAATGMLFYMEFPPIQLNGTPYIDSSPVFNTLNGEYLCLNEPVRFRFGATDPDGDELRYSLATPLAGFATQDNLYGNGPSSNYPTVNWVNGIGVNNQIPGTPPLRVDAKTGILSVTPNQLGLFAFSIICEEYRNGQRIGMARRDFQLLVVDCPNIRPPKPIISARGKIIGKDSVELCINANVVLEAANDPTLSYQWQRDGENIPQGNESQLTVTQPGTYTLVTSLANQCSRSSYSDDVVVKPINSLVKLTAPVRAICNGLSATLRAPTGNYTYRWHRDGIAITSAITNSITVTDPGTYTARLIYTPLGCEIYSDTVRIGARPNPEAMISAERASGEVCRSDSLRMSTNSEKGYKYEWFRDGNQLQTSGNIYFAKMDGAYRVQVIDSAGCTGKSTDFKVYVVDKIAVQLDSIPPFCDLSHPSVLLKFDPPGGVLNGNGVIGQFFDPIKAGYGKHEITYTIDNNALACLQGSAKREVLIIKPPSINLTPVREIPWGSSFQPNQPDKANYTYEWNPSLYLSNTNQANPIIAPEDSITYTLRVTDSVGCSNSAQMRIKIIYTVWIPDVFSPNADGVNDVWELKGIERFPNAEILIYNRWGNLVYYSKGYPEPWSGIYQGKPLPTDTYSYQINTYEGHIYRGPLMLLR